MSQENFTRSYLDSKDYLKKRSELQAEINHKDTKVSIDREVFKKTEKEKVALLNAKKQHNKELRKQAVPAKVRSAKASS